MALGALLLLPVLQPDATAAGHGERGIGGLIGRGGRGNRFDLSMLLKKHLRMVLDGQYTATKTGGRTLVHTRAAFVPH